MKLALPAITCSHLLFTSLSFAAGVESRNCEKVANPAFLKVVQETIERLAAGFQTFGNNKNPQIKDLPGDVRIWGRVLRGKSNSDFEKLSDDPKRKIVGATNIQGIERQLAEAKSTQDLLRMIGYPEIFLRNLVNQGTQFKYILFQKEDVYPATWDNFLMLIEKIDAKIAATIRPFLPELSSKTFAEINKQQPGIDMAAVYERGRSDPDFVSFKVIQNASDAGTLNLWQVRAFFYHEFNVNSLFSGDGFTHDSSGVIGVPEYIMLNSSVENLDFMRFIDLNI